MISSIDPRLNLRVARQRLTSPLFKLTPEQIKNNVILSQSYLRFEVTLQPQVTEYTFPVVVTQQAQNGAPKSQTEVRLQLQDSFFVTHLGYFFQVAADAATSTRYVDMLHTFPSTIDNNMGLSYYNDELNLLWNSSLSLTVMNRVQCPAWDTFRHRVVPETQTPWYSVLPTEGYINSDQQDGSEYGFYPVEPNWTLIGSKNNQLTVALPRAPRTAIEPTGEGSTFTGTYRLVVIVRGILAQNSTVVG